MSNTEQQIKDLSVNALKMRQDNGDIINRPEILRIVKISYEVLGVNPEDIEENQLDKILKKLQMQFSMNLSGEGATLIGDNNVERGWLESLDDHDRSEFKYFKAFNQYLLNLGRPTKVVDKNTKIVDSILDLSGDPLKEGNWTRRGLVMGNVQSGKTQNYTALINKAADVGYKIIIVLGGHQN